MNVINQLYVTPLMVSVICMNLYETKSHWMLSLDMYAKQTWNPQLILNYELIIVDWKKLLFAFKQPIPRPRFLINFENNSGI